MTQRLTLPAALILYAVSVYVSYGLNHPLTGDVLVIASLLMTLIGFDGIESRLVPFAGRVRTIQSASLAWLAGLIASAAYPDSQTVYWFITLLTMPLAALIAIGILRLVLTPRSKLGRWSFLLVLLLLLPLHQMPPVLFAWILLILLIPFIWTRRLTTREAIDVAILGFIHLIAYFLTVPELFGSGSHFYSQWNFITRCTQSVTESLTLVLAITSLCNAVRIGLRPRSIRTRLRWAFLLNFIVPVTLMSAMYIVSILYLVGGYQGASAKRILVRIGQQAQTQATQLWETINGISHEPPPRSPFYRAGLIQFEDGTVEEFGSPPRDLVDQLIETQGVQVGFFRITRPDWQLWIAGFHRDRRSMAVIAYRIDQDMLAYIKDILGFDIILVPGFDYRYLLFRTCKPTQFHIRSPRTPGSAIENEFAIGAASITSNKVLNSDESYAFDKGPDSVATLQVVASRRILAQSLMMTESTDNGTDDMFRASSPVQQDAEPEPTDASETGSTDKGYFRLDSQSVNYLNLIVFAFLALGIGVLIGLIILSLSTSFLINRKINSSVQLIKDGTTQLRKGNLTHQIPITTSDEFGELASDFNMMARSLNAYELEREGVIIERIEQERMREEFETARLIQRSLLPASDPVLRYIDVTGTCVPVTEVGGDYFDYIEYQDGAFGIAIGDVSGHGMSSGLLMSMAKSCLLNQVRVSRDIAEVISSLNIMICDAMKKRLIMTFLFGQISPDGRRLTFASAGHHFPFHYRARPRELVELESVAYPLGVRRELKLEIREVTLEPGDLVVLYTDGIVETLNGQGEMFGFDRLEEAIRQEASRSVVEIREAIMGRVMTFRGEAVETDDITLMVLKVRDE